MFEISLATVEGGRVLEGVSVCLGVSEQPDRGGGWRGEGMGRPQGMEGRSPSLLPSSRAARVPASQGVAAHGSPQRENNGILTVCAPPCIYLEWACFLFSVLHPLPPRAHLWSCLVAEQGDLCKSQARELGDPKLPRKPFH